MLSKARPLPSPADANSCCLQPGVKPGTGELHTLFRIEHL
jgi:hypothetical protein